MGHRLALLVPVLLAALMLAGPSAARPVVVELFTSQGCSSCPPADRLLGELAEREPVIALSLHVDYWNRLGWTDPFSRPAFSERQRAYARTLEDDNPWTTGVYTPQMVVNGRYAVVGHVASRVNRAIDRAEDVPERVHPRIVGHPPEHVIVSPDQESAATRESATVWLIAYDDRHVTPVERGENAGRQLVNHRVVRSMRRVGQWNGRGTRLAIETKKLEERDGLVVLVQTGETGSIIGATERRLSGEDPRH